MIKFSELYHQLNKTQKQAVDSLEGPHLVLAGPGTGKTQVLTLRIANILRLTDTPPYAITALTYTEAAAENMLNRLSQIIGETAYQINISTFHSFSGRIIKQYPEKFPFLRGGRPINIIEKIGLIEEILAQPDFHYLKPFGNTSLYTRYIMRDLSILKRESVSPQRLEKIINKAELAEKNKFRLIELVKFYRIYQERLRKNGLYDFEDMINQVVAKLANDKDLSLLVQERVFYLLVDEYQDTNSAQNKLIQLLSSYWGDKANVFVVGDDDQSIFRFQGASRANFLFFKQLFPKTKIINLSLNYRSRPGLIKLSQGFIQTQRSKFNRQLSINKTIKPAPRRLAKKEDKVVEINYFSSLTQEAEFIAKKIKLLIKRGVSPKEIGIIYRENKDALIYTPFLNKENIPYMVEGQVNILNQPAVKELEILLKVVEKWGQEEALEFIFNFLNLPFFHLSPTLIGQAFYQAHRDKKDIFAFYLDRPKEYEDLWLVFDKFEKLKKESLRLPLPLFIQNLLESTTFLEYLMNEEEDKHQLFYLYAFFNQIKNWYRDKTIRTLDQLSQTLELLEKYNLPLEVEPLFTNAQAVKLTTAHKAKGQEFTYVFIPQFIEKKWSHKVVADPLRLPAEIIEYNQTEDDPRQEKEAEEERLFYVALTRAKEKVFITIPENVWSDGVVKKVSPSAFLQRLDKSLIKEKKHEDSLENLEKTIYSLFKPAKEVFLPQDYWRAAVEKIKLSPTGLKTYLECPYRFLLNNLYRLPRVKTASLILGSAVHKSLEEWLIAYRQGKNEKVEFLIEVLKDYLEGEILEKTERERILKEGTFLLKRFHKEELLPHLSERVPYKAELDFGSQHIFTPEGVPITGKVDRIDKIDENTFLVIDYKTGRIPSKRSLNDYQSDYRRQLSFYALLLASQPEFADKKLRFALWFIGNRQDKPLFFSFTPSQEEKIELRGLLKSSWQKIQRLEFPRTKERKNCRYCPYRFHCFPRGIAPKLD